MENGIRAGLKTWISFPEVTKRDLRIFGLIISGILFAMQFRHLNIEISMFSVTGLILVLCSALKPDLLRVPHAIWMTLGHILGSINTRIILVILYVTIFVPIGVLLRLFGKRLIDTRFIESLETYRNESSDRERNHFEHPF